MAAAAGGGATPLCANRGQAVGHGPACQHNTTQHKKNVVQVPPPSHTHYHTGQAMPCHTAHQRRRRHTSGHTQASVAQVADCRPPRQQRHHTTPFRWTCYLFIPLAISFPPLRRNILLTSPWTAMPAARKIYARARRYTVAASAASPHTPGLRHAALRTYTPPAAGARARRAQTVACDHGTDGGGCTYPDGAIRGAA